jgi:DNA-binding protein YbaB
VSNPLEKVLADALKDFEQKQSQFDERRQRMNALSASATAPRQVVSVTVGARGELTSLTFPTSAYKRMPPAELAAVILKTAEEARSQVMKQTAELLAPSLPAGVSAEELLNGKVNLNAFLSRGPRGDEL